MSIGTDWLPVQSTLSPPSVDVAVSIDLWLNYFGTTGVASFDVVAAVKAAVAGIVNAAEGMLSVDTITVAALAVPGVLGVRSATLNGVTVDITAASFTIRPEYVGVYVGVVG